MFSSLNTLFSNSTDDPSSSPATKKPRLSNKSEPEDGGEEGHTEEDSGDDKDAQLYFMDLEFERGKSFVKKPLCFQLCSSLPLPQLYNFRKVYEVPDHIFFSLTFFADNEREIYEDTQLILRDHFSLSVLPYVPTVSQLEHSGAHVYDTHAIIIRGAKVHKIQFSVHNVNVDDVYQVAWRPYINWFDGPFSRRFGALRVVPIKPYVNIEEFNSVAFEDREMGQRTPAWYARRSRNGLDNRYDRKRTLRNKKVGTLCEVEALYIFLYSKSALIFEEAGFKNKCSPDGFIINRRRNNKRSILEIKCTVNCDVRQCLKAFPPKTVKRFLRQSSIAQCVRNCISRGLQSFYLVKLFIDGRYFSLSLEKLRNAASPLMACHCWYVELDNQAYWDTLASDKDICEAYCDKITTALNGMASRQDVGNHPSVTWELLNVPVDELLEQVREFRIKKRF